MSKKELKKIRWGIIGCGDVTEVKSGPGFQKAKGSELVAVMRRTSNLAKSYAQRHQVPKWYDDADLLIADPEVDAVYIATPPSTHMKYTFAVARAGKPVYVEKPMALNYWQCLKMIKACEEAKIPLFTAYYRRALPKFLKIKSIIEKGKIGHIRNVNIRFYQSPSKDDLQGVKHWRVNPQIAGCGYFCDLGSHMIDLLQFFFGPIESAKGFSSNQSKLYEAEDIVTATYLFDNGIHGTGSWIFNTNRSLDQTEIVGSNGQIIYSTFTDEPILLNINGNVKKYDIKYPQHVQQPLIQKIVDELLGFGKSPSTGISGSLTNKVMDEILNS